MEISFPEDLFKPGKIRRYLSAVACNLLGLGALKKAQIQDLIIPG